MYDNPKERKPGQALPLLTMARKKKRCNLLDTGKKDEEYKTDSKHSAPHDVRYATLLLFHGFPFPAHGQCCVAVRIPQRQSSFFRAFVDAFAFHKKYNDRESCFWEIIRLLQKAHRDSCSSEGLPNRPRRKTKGCCLQYHPPASNGCSTHDDERDHGTLDAEILLQAALAEEGEQDVFFDSKRNRLHSTFFRRPSAFLEALVMEHSTETKESQLPRSRYAMLLASNVTHTAGKTSLPDDVGDCRQPVRDQRLKIHTPRPPPGR